MSIYTDLDYVRDTDGIYDLDLDLESGDLALIDGIDAALMVSMFSDRRAREDEVTDPFKRRGWIGDLVAEVPDDRHGSGLWLYEQARLTRDVTTGLRIEAEAALQWMIDERLIRTAQAEVVADPARRLAVLTIRCALPSGEVTERRYDIVNRTIRRQIARNY